MTTSFVKAGNRIFPKPKGLDYTLIGGQVYNLLCDNYGQSWFEEDGTLNLNFKEYNTEEDINFRERVLKYHKSTTKQTTGVLLHGVKGTGKTVMAKQIARDSGLPVIVVSTNYRTSLIAEFFTKFEQDLVVIFDEIDKDDNYWSHEHLLGFLDGVQTTAKKLVLMTANESDKINQYLEDRCSRIRYKKEFKLGSNEKFLKDIILDKGFEDKDHSIYNFILSSFKVLSIDNILSFLDEKALFPDIPNEELVGVMNITINSTYTPTTPKEEVKTITSTGDPEVSSLDLYEKVHVYEPDEPEHHMTTVFASLCNMNEDEG